MLHKIMFEIYKSIQNQNVIWKHMDNIGLNLKVLIWNLQTKINMIDLSLITLITTPTLELKNINRDFRISTELEKCNFSLHKSICII